ncbi:MAG: bifunctional phosphoribosylaminoimidazolecarboxamide formyltransferase/IMP cyclohydrolase, partial [Pseudomonadales bacterium]
VEESSLSNFTQIQGKDLSFNNLNDSDNAWECVKNFSEPTCVIVKHANPCGVCSSENIEKAYLGAFSTDPTSAFGGIIALNKIIDSITASLIIKQFVEVVIAPSFSPEAIKIFQTKENIRLLTVPIGSDKGSIDFKKIGGGWLVQSADRHQLKIDGCEVVSMKKPTENQLIDMLFAWKVAQYVKSNAIVFCNNRQTVGVGAGQMSRIDSTKIAAIKAQNAGLSVEGSVVASDAFFPFRDGVDELARHGAECVIQPGGSIRDQEVIDAADEHGLVMLFTKIRHFKH